MQQILQGLPAGAVGRKRYLEGRLLLARRQYTEAIRLLVRASEAAELSAEDRYRVWMALERTCAALAGFDPAGVRSKHGLGLSSMQERVRLVGAELTVTSVPARGTTVEVRVPLEARNASEGN